MVSSINETNNQLAKYIIASFNENDMPINEPLLQKVAFKIKMDLGKNHPLYNRLPFYWYCYGPFSETMRDSFLSVKSFLKPVGDCFSVKKDYVDEFKSDILDEASEIEDITGDLISKGNYVYSSLSEDIYKQFAPLDMIHEFRYGIFNPTENNEFLGDADEYVKTFEDCMFELFLNQFNTDYCLLFSKLQIHLDLLNEENQIEKLWLSLRKPIRNLWFTFAQGLRIEAHDNYYNTECDHWNMIFNRSLSQLDSIISDFIIGTKDLIDLSKYGEMTEWDKEFMGSLLDIYWGDD